jgi:hypothetical protein
MAAGRPQGERSTCAGQFNGRPGTVVCAGRRHGSMIRAAAIFFILGFSSVQVSRFQVRASATSPSTAVKVRDSEPSESVFQGVSFIVGRGAAANDVLSFTRVASSKFRKAAPVPRAKFRPQKIFELVTQPH